MESAAEFPEAPDEIRSAPSAELLHLIEHEPRAGSFCT